MENTWKQLEISQKHLRGEQRAAGSMGSPRVIVVVARWDQAGAHDSAEKGPRLDE